MCLQENNTGTMTEQQTEAIPRIWGTPPSLCAVIAPVSSYNLLRTLPLPHSAPG